MITWMNFKIRLMKQWMIKKTDLWSLRTATWSQRVPWWTVVTSRAPGSSTWSTASTPLTPPLASAPSTLTPKWGWSTGRRGRAVPSPRRQRLCCCTAAGGPKRVWLLQTRHGILLQPGLFKFRAFICVTVRSESYQIPRLIIFSKWKANWELVS